MMGSEPPEQRAHGLSIRDSEQLLRDVGALLTHHNAMYVSNPGNLGDALITAGLASGLGGMWHRQKPASRYKGKERVVVYSGGGNLVGLYDDCQRAIERFMIHDGGTFVLLPHTVRNCARLIHRLDSRFTFYLRDVPSYEYVTQLNPRITCHLAHDLALMLNRAHAAQLMRHVPLGLLGSMLRPRSRGRYFLRAIRDFHRHRPRSREARIFRRDVEARGTTSGEQTLDSFDLSALYVSAYRTCRESLLAAGLLLRFLDRYEVIHTDRLHISIAGALLGKRVLLYDNSYGKNRDVFQLSLSSRPDFNIEFRG